MRIFHNIFAIVLFVVLGDATVDAFVTPGVSSSSSLVGKTNPPHFVTTGHLPNPIIIRKHNSNDRQPSSSNHFSVANTSNNENESNTPNNLLVTLLQKIKLQQALAKILNNLLFILTIPFPELRALVLRNRRRIKNKAKKDSGTNMAFSLGLKEGLFGLLAYFAVGVFSYHKVFEKYSFVDALYYTCVCFSTVG